MSFVVSPIYILISEYLELVATNEDKMFVFLAFHDFSFLKAKLCFVSYISYVYLSVEGHVGRSDFLTILTRSELNMAKQVSVL